MKWVKQDSVKEFWDSKEQKNICLLIWKPVVLELLKMQYTNTYFFFSPMALKATIDKSFVKIPVCTYKT